MFKFPDASLFCEQIPGRELECRGGKKEKVWYNHQENEKISGTGESNLIAGELRAYLKLQFEESVGPPATGKKWRRQSTEFHQVLVLTRGCDEAKQDQGVTVMTVNGI